MTMLDDDNTIQDDTPLFPDPLRQVEEALSQTSALNALRARYQRIAANTDVYDVPIPGYDGLLIGRYQKPSNQTMKTVQRNLTREAKRNPTDAEINAAADLLVEALVELRVPKGKKELRKDDPDPTAPLAEPGEPPMIYDNRLAESMGMPGAARLEPHMVVRELFGGERCGAPIIAHFGAIMGWASGSSEDAAERTLGG
jgi:hypothetical protein